ncbi:MAG: hypothetical protein IJZ85_00160 [Lachnospiraceae bacterium]|nr:hypothetical protein [Lachnospiraceae bacterium]
MQLIHILPTMNPKHLTIYSIAHFLVDFSCALLLFGSLSASPDFALCVLFYNFCAFALQMPFGLLADSWNRNSIVAAVGCFLVALAYFVPFPMLTAIIAGMGNALFHLGGGIDTLNHSEKKATALGIFVSPGAIGLYLGTLWGKSGTVSVWLGIIPLILVGLLILLICRQPGKGFTSENALVSPDTVISAKWLIPLFLVVVLRSYMGMNQQFAWKSEGSWAWILIFALALGKMAGGILMDRMGARKASLYTLIGAAILYLLSGHPIPGVLSVFLFNMTMPVTLWAVAKITPGMKGFTFGLLTFALFIGYLPSAVGAPSLLTDYWTYSVIAVLSLALLLMVYKALHKGGVSC